MKKQLLILMLAASVFPLACTKDKATYQNDLAASYDAWWSFKNASGNSYRYTVRFSSWANGNSETTISVRKGKVSGRSYKSEFFNSQTPTVLQEWSETEDSLNTHVQGAATITLDEIYRKAKADWLRKRENVRYYFEAKNGGLISVCGYISDECQDDCFQGIHISLIEKL